MKRLSTLILAGLLILSLGGATLAYETDFDDLHRFDRNLPTWKLGRGVTNMCSLPHEVFSNMANEAINGNMVGAYGEGMFGSFAGALNGYIAGFGIGMIKGVKRMTTGVVEVLTFWKPEYGPTIDPTYGTRCKAFGDQDYFDSAPFWYTGPEDHR
jgi:hypothetical protein